MNPKQYQLPQGVRVISAFPGTGKSSLCAQNRAFIDLDLPELKNDAPQYIERIRQALEIPGAIVMVPTRLNLRLGMHREGIEFALFYPSFDLMADYYRRFVNRGSSEEFRNKITQMWDVYLTTILNDRTEHKVEMQQSQAYLSDYFL